MKAIKFNEKELEFLREQYQDELTQAKEYVNQIIGLLNKLGVRSKSVKKEPIEPNVYKKRGHKLKVKVVESKGPPKKRGRKPKVLVPAVELKPAPAPKPEKNEFKKKVAKVKVGKKAVHKEPPLKKSTAKEVTAPVPEVKVAPKKDVKKKATKKKSVKVETPPKIIPIKDVKEAPKKKVKKVAKKKSLEKRRIEEMAKSAKLDNPSEKKEPIIETVTPTVEPIIPSVEETKD